ncbi:MAG: hypothetical protein M3Y27_24340 [Acidobacteriota bacterium]|nr:hypothetical protein [Acidobacteriota bacterium]
MIHVETAPILIMADPLSVWMHVRRVGMAATIAKISRLRRSSVALISTHIIVATSRRILFRSVLWNEATANPAALVLMLLLLVLLDCRLPGTAPVFSPMATASMLVAVLGKRRKANRQ